ncbi:MAG: integration host factor subunit beta [Planctomycetaceae bacterium]|nr:integration host factor subunit beta [Planctomycetaceae bacterium]
MLLTFCRKSVRLDVLQLVLRNHPDNLSHPLFNGETIVTKKEIVRIIAEELDETQMKTKDVVQKTFDVIIKTLVAERRVELRNFGVFEVKKRGARMARNPRTGEEVMINQHYVVTFKPGKEMENKIAELLKED